MNDRNFLIKSGTGDYLKINTNSKIIKNTFLVTFSI